MREYEMEVLEKYELEVNSTRRIRGAFYCDTKEGTMLLKETKISERRVPLLYLILNRLEKQGYLVDTPQFSHLSLQLLFRNQNLSDIIVHIMHGLFLQYYDLVPAPGPQAGGFAESTGSALSHHPGTNRPQSLPPTAKAPGCRRPAAASASVQPQELFPHSDIF